MKLVNFYDVAKYKDEERVTAPSIITVINYLVYCLERLNVPIEIISAAETRKSSGDFPMRSERIGENIVLTQCATHGYTNKLKRVMSKVKSRLWLVKYLLQNTKENELIFFGDSPVLYEPLLLFRILDRKKVKILYFATEIYQYVIPMGRMKRQMEWKLFRDADMLFVSTKMLDEKINKGNRKSLILHGTYKLPPKYDERFTDSLHHILYAGVINEKKGSMKAVEIATFLPADYHINIIGFGKEEDVASLRKSIVKANAVNACQITFDGTITGEAYDRYLQKCDIGICPQDLQAKYNDSSFPSKILSYLSNGLRVVSVDLPAVHTSEIGDLLYYAKSDSARDFAEAIMSIDMQSEYDSREVINELDRKFMQGLAEMMKGYNVK